MRFVVIALVAGLGLAACSKERSESINLINDGLTFESQGSRESAYSNYLRATKIDPANHRAFFHLALMEMFDRNEAEKGVLHLEEAAKLAPDDRDVLYHLGRYYATAAVPNVDKALASLDAALKIDPNYAPAHYHRGVALLVRDDFRGADLAFREAIACDPGYGLAYRDLGLLYERFDEDDVALKVYQVGADNADDKIDIFNNMGQLLMRAGKIPDAVAAFEQALRIGGARHDTIFNLAFAQVENQQPRLAFEYLVEFINRADVSQGEQIKIAMLLKDAMQRELERKRALEEELKALDQ